jgi:hypothetical protein
MRTEFIDAKNPWVVTATCPECGMAVRAWRSSGMSQSCPHFYCDKCSNAIAREKDKEIAWNAQPSTEIVEKIAATLPSCPCGGRFRPGANPK